MKKNTCAISIKWHHCFFAFFLVLFCSYSTAFAGTTSNDKTRRAPILKVANTTEAKSIVTFELPESLITIGTEAFEGTSITTIKIPAKVEGIGEHAFANIPTLKMVHLPDSVREIGLSAFQGSNKVTIASTVNSHAKAWADANSIPFRMISAFSASNSVPQYNTHFNQQKTKNQKFILNEDIEDEEEPESTGRNTGEVKTEQLKQITASHILGRSPPSINS